jgi:hypothetical protein
VYAAVLDTCVLVPNALCDTLLRLAEQGFYRPLWSERILAELRQTLAGLYPTVDPARFGRRTDAMTAAFEDACVVGWEAVCAGLDLPDPDDRHVLAAAIVGGGQAIVTANLKDLPAETLSTYGVEARDPDTFLLDQLDLAPSRTLEILLDQAADLHNPPMDLAGLLTALARCGVPNFVEAVRRLAPEHT